MPSGTSKRWVTSALALTVVVACSGGRQTHGTHDDPPGRPVNAAAMLGVRAGWALTEGRLGTTVDGGETWRDITPIDILGPELRDAFFLDGKTGWLVGESPRGTLRIYRFQNTQWRVVKAPIPGAHASISFSDAEHGWLVATVEGERSATTYSTADGGVTWTEQATVTTGRILAISPARALVTGGGWLQVVEGGRASRTARAISNAVTDGKRTWVVGERGGSHALLTSSDGGTTWSATPLTTKASGALARAGAELLSAVKGVVVRISPCCVSRASVGLGAPVRALSFADEQNGWAIAGSPAKLFATGDGGATWRALAP